MHKSDYCADCWQRRIDSNQGSRKLGLGLQISAWLTLTGLIVWNLVTDSALAVYLAEAVLSDDDWRLKAVVSLGLAFALWSLLMMIGKWLSLGYGIFDRLPGEEVPLPNRVKNHWLFRFGRLENWNAMRLIGRGRL